MNAQCGAISSHAVNFNESSENLGDVEFRQQRTSQNNVLKFSLKLPAPKQLSAKQSVAPISSSRLSAGTSVLEISSDSTDPFSELNIDF